MILIEVLNLLCDSEYIKKFDELLWWTYDKFSDI